MIAQGQLSSFDSQHISADTMLPDLLGAHPEARGVFDQYGLRGCGGDLGPVESIAFFANTHGVDLTQLLGEIQQAIAAPPATAARIAPSVADTIYRRFFIAGIAVVLTAGASWGAWLLIKIGLAGKFTGISIHDINAHGHAQIFGWVGLFMMGFAYQAFPRLWHVDLPRPKLAVAAFLAMLAGIIIRTVAMPLAGHAPALAAAMLGGSLEVAALAIFIGQILSAFVNSDARLEPYIGFAIAALIFFLAMSLMSLWHTYNTMSAATREGLLWYVATYQGPLRDVQIHGLAMLMILGVSMRMLPPLFGVSPVPARRAWWALAILSFAVIAEVIIFIAYRWTNNHVIAATLLIPWAMLAVGAGMIALPWRLWRRLPLGDRSAKFVRAAYAWLAISLLMLLVLPVYQSAIGTPFSHAYYGAIRHAITVGFISLMIMGFAAKVVPTLNGIDTRTLPALYGPFILINVGCFLRVSLQTLTDVHPVFYAIVGISGVLEVTALTWWGLPLVRIMRRGKRESAREEHTTAVPNAILPEHRVADVLDWFPDTQAVFDQYGFSLLRNPLMRRTLARTVTLSQAAQMKGVSREDLLRDLNQAMATR